MHRLLLPLVLMGALSADAFVPEGEVWGAGLVTFETNLPPFDRVAAMECAQWARYTNRTQLFPLGAPTTFASPDQHNSIVWSGDTGYTLPSNVLAVTVLQFSNGVMQETDVVVNSTLAWSSYDSVLIYPIWDIGRVLLHELGHCIGLDHAPNSIMSPTISNTYQLTPDDIAGVSYLYGGPTETTHRLLNISTRGKVGVGEDVMIAGFIVSGNENVVVRALGPSLERFNITGWLSDPELAIYDASGNLVPASANVPPGLVPPDPSEPALQVNLTSGNYTAIVRGKNNTTGVALVEVYEQ